MRNFWSVDLFRTVFSTLRSLDHRQSPLGRSIATQTNHLPGNGLTEVDGRTRGRFAAAAAGRSHSPAVHPDFAAEMSLPLPAGSSDLRLPERTDLETTPFLRGLGTPSWTKIGQKYGSGFHLWILGHRPLRCFDGGGCSRRSRYARIRQSNT